jgi:hypothetical protein
MYQVCPVRQQKGNVPRNGHVNTWVHVTAHGTLEHAKDEEERMEVPPAENYGPKNTAKRKA